MFQVKRGHVFLSSRATPDVTSCTAEFGELVMVQGCPNKLWCLGRSFTFFTSLEMLLLFPHL